jgi:hypothetical protein
MTLMRSVLEFLLTISPLGDFNTNIFGRKILFYFVNIVIILLLIFLSLKLILKIKSLFSKKVLKSFFHKLKIHKVNAITFNTLTNCVLFFSIFIFLFILFRKSVFYNFVLYSDSIDFITQIRSFFTNNMLGNEMFIINHDSMNSIFLRSINPFILYPYWGFVGVYSYVFLLFENTILNVFLINKIFILIIILSLFYLCYLLTKSFKISSLFILLLSFFEYFFSLFQSILSNNFFLLLIVFSLIHYYYFLEKKRKIDFIILILFQMLLFLSRQESIFISFIILMHFYTFEFARSKQKFKTSFKKILRLNFYSILILIFYFLSTIFGLFLIPPNMAGNVGDNSWILSNLLNFRILIKTFINSFANSFSGIIFLLLISISIIYFSILSILTKNMSYKKHDQTRNKSNLNYHNFPNLIIFISIFYLLFYLLLDLDSAVNLRINISYVPLLFVLVVLFFFDVCNKFKCSKFVLNIISNFNKFYFHKFITMLYLILFVVLLSSNLVFLTNTFENSSYQYVKYNPYILNCVEEKINSLNLFDSKLNDFDNDGQFDKNLFFMSNRIIQESLTTQNSVQLFYDDLINNTDLDGIYYIDFDNHFDKHISQSVFDTIDMLKKQYYFKKMNSCNISYIISKNPNINFDYKSYYFSNVANSTIYMLKK